jgi:hypothetical protein
VKAARFSLPQDGSLKELLVRYWKGRGFSCADRGRVFCHPNPTLQAAEKLDSIRRPGSAALQHRVQVLYFFVITSRLQPARDLFFSIFQK